MKKVLSVLMLFLMLSACGNGGGSGEAIELDLEKVQTFENGFLYIKWGFESEQQKEDFNLKQIKKVAKAENIDFYTFHAKKDTAELELNQRATTLCFYENGEIKAELNLINTPEDDVHPEVEKFIQNVKED